MSLERAEKSGGMKVQPLPGNILVVRGKSMMEQFEYAKQVSASVKVFVPKNAKPDVPDFLTDGQW